MSKPKQANKPVTAFLRIVLSVGTDLGGVPLEDALRRARELKVTDVLDLSGLDHNDSSIEVTGVFTSSDV
jgi:hypothetical protein